jgi:chromate transporter
LILIAVKESSEFQGGFMETQEKKVSLWTLFWVMAKIGVMTFGGGYAMLPILQRELVENRHWATDEDLANYFAIGQCTPGVIAVNTSTFIGYRMHGVIGGIVATLGEIFPSLCIITALAGLISNFSDNLYVQKAFIGIRVCVCVLIFNAVVKLYKGAVKGKLTFIIFLVVALLSTFTGVSPVLIVVADMAFGVLLEVFMGRRGGSDAGSGKTEDAVSTGDSASGKEAAK